MKKTLALILALCMVFALAACGTDNKPVTSGANITPSETQKQDTPATPSTSADLTPTEPIADVMTHDEYVAAPLDSDVKIETYVQATQSWWDGKITIYAQSPDGAYFIYNAACSEEDAAKLVPGTKIAVEGVKSEWSGEVEIVDGTFEILDGEPYYANPEDVTELLGDPSLIDHQNEYVSFLTMTVEPIGDDGAAFLYNWDGSGQEGSDLYFNASVNGVTYNFTVESYLTGSGTDVYEAVKGLRVGDVIDMVGYLYWYNGANPHITSVTKSEYMSHADYLLAELDSPVSVITYVQATQSWWDGKLTIYAQSPDGAYFIYNAACDEATAKFLVPGTKIAVSGYKSEWSGEVEIVDAAISPFSNGNYIAEPTDVTALLGTEELIAHQNEFVSFKGMKVEPVNGDKAFMYGWDGSGEDGSDLYFDVSVNGHTYTFTVESYLCGPGTEVYEAVKNLKVGDTVDMEGFLYWYEGVNPHITSVTVK